MNEKTTVDNAIKRGKWLINYPARTILFASIFIAIYLQIQNIITGWLIIPIVYILPFLLAFLYWCITITKWRIWAFTNVRNVHELKKRAIQERLIGLDNSFYQKAEIKIFGDKKKWDSLLLKFEKEDVFQDNIFIPKQTMIFYSKSKNSIQMLLGISSIILGGYLIFNSRSLPLGILLVLGGLYLTYKEFREVINTTPQIILDEKGIETIKTKFHNWESIKNEEVICQGFGKNRHYYLIYEYPGGREYLQIDSYTTNMKALNKLLILYRGRSKQKNNFIQQTAKLSNDIYN
ncbi:hypothetical protein [Flavobacterium sp. KMS]|uniref:hypothetical protein n=1 Tax=Flavobacterium sp. KMS TaxID=1566023 RepID=UPI000690B228|nr:hypothetical protein [Flavobacterium sp. KMS]